MSVYKRNYTWFQRFIIFKNICSQILVKTKMALMNVLFWQIESVLVVPIFTSVNLIFINGLILYRFHVIRFIFQWYMHGWSCLLKLHITECIKEVSYLHTFILLISWRLLKLFSQLKFVLMVFLVRFKYYLLLSLVYFIFELWFVFGKPNQIVYPVW